MYVMVALMLAAQAASGAETSAPDPSTSSSAESVADPRAPETAAPSAAPAPASPVASGAAATSSVAAEISVDAIVDDVMARALDAVRVAVPPVQDSDRARVEVLQLRVVRALIDRGREEVVTPAMVQRALGDAGASALAGDLAPLKALSADHVLLSEVVDAGGEVRLRLKLLHVETGAVLAESSGVLSAAATATSARATTVRRGIDAAVDQLSAALAKLPGDVRYQRVVVAPLEAQGEAVSAGRVDRFVQAELGEGLRQRGYLVVERDRLSSAMAQLTLAAQLGESDAPELGKMLDAQAIVLGSVSEAGEAFVLSLRAVGTEGGAVLGAADARLPREGVVTLASDAIETRSAGEAFFRSAVAPGWGQFYNRQSVKGAAFGVATYGAALTTVGLGVSTAVLASLYDNYSPADGVTPQQAGQEAKGLREQANVLFTTTAISGGLTALLWSAGAVDALLDGMAYE